MKQGIYTVISNEALTDCVYKMVLQGDTSAFTAPGQFVNLTVEGLYLRRPISVFDWDETTVTIIYKVVGEGTEKMAQWEAGYKCDVLTGLGNGFDVSKSGDEPVLIGGGVGIPPMFGLAKRLIAQGKKVKVILGFNKESEIFCKEDFEKIGAETYVTTVDGSVGIKGFVTDALKDMNYTYFYTCSIFNSLEHRHRTAGIEVCISHIFQCICYKALDAD